MENSPINNLSQGDTASMENGLQALWVSIRRAGDMIVHLREEKVETLSRLTSLEQEVSHLKKELLEKQQLLETLQQKQPKAGDSKHTVHFNGDREALFAQVKDLLSRIEGYL